MTLAPVEAALQSLFPAGVAVAVEPVMGADPSALWPEERTAIRGAVPRRLAEFAAGRAAARRALTKLGHRPVALPVGEDRAAIWPDGVAGAIAHAADLAVAVARRSGLLGVDLEPDGPLEAALWPLICGPEELQRLHGDTGRLVRQVFCAKEAVFKAQPADGRAMFGFEALDVTLVDGGFNAQFRASVGVFVAGQVVTGRMALFDDLILAGVAL